MTQYLKKNSSQPDYSQIIDLYPLFSDANDLMTSSYSIDGIHLSEAGYIVWQNFIKGFVNDL